MSTRSRRRRRRVGVAIVGLAATIAIVVLALRDVSPVGHFSSAEHAHRFDRAYSEAMEELPEGAQSLDVRTDFGIVRLYRFDAKEPPGVASRGEVPLVLVPGRASASPVWADNIESLRTIGPLYLIDLLGEPGESVQSRPIDTDADQAAWLHQVLETLPEPEVHLVGYSIGGWTAANLAVHDSSRVASLTLIDPASTFADLPVELVVRSIPASVPWLPKSWRDDFASYTAGGAPVEDEPIAQLIEAGMQGYRIKLPAPTRFSDAELASIEAPTLVIIAGESVMHDPEDAAATAERALVDATVLTYDGASHAVNGEEPKRLADDIAAIVASVRAQ
jgi:pimeloyl-ACP methyl ester carboxylesterase